MRPHVGDDIKHEKEVHLQLIRVSTLNKLNGNTKRDCRHQRTLKKDTITLSAKQNLD